MTKCLELVLGAASWWNSKIQWAS